MCKHYEFSHDYAKYILAWLCRFADGVLGGVDSAMIPIVY